MDMNNPPKAFRNLKGSISIHIKEQVLHYLDTELEDNIKASLLQPDGSYEKEDLRGKKKVNSQEQFVEEANAAAAEAAEAEKKKKTNGRTFVPMEAQ